MRYMNLSVCSVIGIFAVILSLTSCICAARIVKSETPLKCHVCDGETCKDFNKKAKEPKECSIDDLINNIGPSKLFNFSYVHFSQNMPVPLFACQKIEAYDIRGITEVRRCQVRLPGNSSCDRFQNNVNNDPAKTYRNVTCVLCETDGCNSSGLIYIWTPLLLSSFISTFLIK